MITNFKIFEDNTEEPLYLFTIFDLEEVVRTIQTIQTNKFNKISMLFDSTLGILKSLIGSKIKIPAYYDKFFLISVRLKTPEEYQSSTGTYIFSFIEDTGGYSQSLIDWKHGDNSAESDCPNNSYNEIIEVFSTSKPEPNEILEITTKRIKQRRTEKKFDL